VDDGQSGCCQELRRHRTAWFCQNGKKKSNRFYAQCRDVWRRAKEEDAMVSCNAQQLICCLGRLAYSNQESIDMASTAPDAPAAAFDAFKKNQYMVKQS